MTAMSILSAKSLPKSLALLRATGNPCLQPWFWRSRNVGAAYQPRDVTLPKWEGDHFHPELVSSSGALPSAPKTHSYSIPIALGPAQFNEFYR